METIVLSRERKERSRIVPKKNKRIERVLKNIGTIYKGTERKLLEKERLESGTLFYFQECILSRERILNKECVLNHLEIIKRFF